MYDAKCLAKGAVAGIIAGLFMDYVSDVVGTELKRFYEADRSWTMVHCEPNRFFHSVGERYSPVWWADKRRDMFVCGLMGLATAGAITVLGSKKKQN